MSRKMFFRKQRKRAAWGLLRGFGWVARNAALAGGTWIVYSRLAIDHKAALGPAVAGTRREMDSQAAGRLSYYYEAAEGRPLVLVHSINAAASAYEMKPLFEHYRGRRPVYALDLPGYGLSNHDRREYTPEVFASVIREFLETQVQQPADVVALSLSAEFAARVALERPDLIHSLALISPSGMTTGGSASRRAGQAGASQRLHEVFTAPLWGQALFDLIATRASIRYFLQRSFVGPVPEELVDYDYLNSHQPGAEIVPLYFISGGLFTRNAIETLYTKVSAPALVIYDQDGFTSFEGLARLMEACPNWRAQRIIPSKGLPHFERLEETAKALDEFWARQILT